MRVVVIMSDAAGYPNRTAVYRRTMEAAGVPFVLVSPADAAQPDSIVTSVPEKWLPASHARKEWYRNHLHYLMAIKTSGIEAEHYWCVEADVDASPATWLRLLETTANMEHDGLWTSLRHRVESPENAWFTDPSTPADADWYCLGALFRISRRAVDWLFEAAEESREVFTEIHVPSEIARRGGTVGKINRPHHQILYNCQTMKFTQTVNGFTYPPARGAAVFMHPVKHDVEKPLAIPDKP